METKTKFCKHCGQIIDYDCIVCPKCGKQVEELKRADTPIVINNTANATANATIPNTQRKLPWYLSWFWICVFGLCTGGIYFIIGIIMRSNWKSHN